MKEDQDELKKLKKEYEKVEVPQEIDFAIEKAIKRGKAFKRVYSWKKRGVIAAVAILTVSTTIYGTIVMKGNSDISPLTKNSASKSDSSMKEVKLPVVGTKENLNKLMASLTSGTSSGISTLGMADKTTAGSTKSYSAENPMSNGTVETAYSITNVQVEGIDEADIVKNDGDFIYKLSGSSLAIVKANPANSMEIIKKIDYSKDFYPSGLFIKGKYIVVIGNGQAPFKADDIGVKSVNPNFLPSMVTTTKAIVYDITDKSNPQQVKVVEVGGNYTSSRMIGSEVYLFSNQNNTYYYPADNSGDFKNGANKTTVIEPIYKDSSQGEAYKNVDCTKISYMPDNLQNNYIMTASINLDNIKENAKITSTLGGGNTVYVSDKNIYIIGGKYPYALMGDSKAPQSFNGADYTTQIYKFGFNNGNIVFSGMTTVPGTTINQFSMDEYGDYFRIATNIPRVSSTNADQSPMNNNVYILDNKLNIVGKIEGIAPDERIYSTRFIGDRLYMVTFKNTDPLFVIDLKDAKAPKILGELKIPGFSNYLQPYDATHIIGFGKEAEDVTMQSGDGTSNVISKSKGFKMALFDVSDVTKPVEDFTTSIGDYGTYSELLNDHKALLFSKEKNIISFPITVTRANGANNSVSTVFQGAYVYSVDMTKGFVLKGKITHVDGNSRANDINGSKGFSDMYYVDNMLQRILYIGDNLYTLSNSYIKANRIVDMSEIGSLKLK